MRTLPGYLSDLRVVPLQFSWYLTDIHTKSNNSFIGITQYVTEGKTGKSKNAIGETTALRWEPTHVTKHTSRDIPLQSGLKYNTWVWYCVSTCSS